MNEIKIIVRFKEHECYFENEKDIKSLISGDYNSTKLVFDFDREDGTKVFEMKNENNEIVYASEIDNNELILVGKDENDNNCTLFNTKGTYAFEVTLYGNDSKLTSVHGAFSVQQEEVVISDNVAESHLPIFDEMINNLNDALNEVETIDIDVEKEDSTTTVTLTKKDGTTKEVEILDGVNGQDGKDGQDGVNGQDGITPTIGDNGNWYLGDTDTGKPSRGEKGDKGDTGNDGINGQDGYTPQKGIDYFTSEDIASLNIPAKTSQLQNDSGFLTNLTNNLVNYTLKTNTGSLIDLEINQTTYVVTLKLKDVDGNIISTDTIDLPLENVVVSGRYDNNTKKVILTLENGSEVDFSVADLVAGLQTEITSQNKLASDLVDDTNSGNKFVTSSEKQTWNNKLDSSDLTNYITNTDYVESGKAGIIRLSSGLGASNGYIYLTVYSYENYNSATNGLFVGKGTLENVITGKNLETGNNKVTTISSSSTNVQYPSAKAVYDYIQSLDGDEVSY